MKVVHLVSDNTRVTGYSIRTQRIISEQIRQGIDAVAIEPSPGVGRAEHVHRVLSLVERVSGVSATNLFQDVDREILAAADLMAVAEGVDDADIVHSHTPWWTTVVGDWLADMLGVPHVFEVRGLQEESAVVDGRRDRYSPWYQTWRAMGDWARQSPEHVVAISPELVRDAWERGAERVSLTPNAVDPDMFRPVDEAQRQAIRAKYQIGDGPIVGYFGSIRPLEGIEELIRALPLLVQLVPGVRVLVMGNGDASSILHLAKSLGVHMHVDFRGPVEPDVVPEILPCVDCVAITRPDKPVCRIVTPLKPLEALACEVPVVSSDLPALRFVGEAGTLFYRPGDLEDLANMVALAIAQRLTIGPAGREWVSKERTWKHLVDVQLGVYRSLGVGA